MTTMNFKISKLADGSAIFPTFRKLWKNVKLETGTRCRSPRSISVTSEPQAVVANDYDCCRRFAVDLGNGEILKSVHVSCGEWACSNTGQEKAISGQPENVAILTATWNDHYRYCFLDMQVHPNNLPKQIESMKNDRG